MFFIFGSSVTPNFYNNVDLSSSKLTSSEIDKGGLFNTGVDFSRFLGFIGLGVGLPSDTPSWFAAMFIAWQTLISIFTVGFVVSSIWNG